MNLSATIKHAKDKLTKLKQDRLLKNVSWMFMSEFFSKFSRVLVVVVMAATLTPKEFGLLSLSVVIFELIRVFSRAGAGIKVIQCRDEELPAIAGNASLLQWITCILIAYLQIALATIVANFYNEPGIAEILRYLALSYLLFPIVATKVFMVQRNNQLGKFASANVASMTADNISLCLFLLLGCGVYSIVYAKLLASIVWVVFFSFCHVPRFSPALDKPSFLPLLKTSINVFTTEALRVLRFHIDVIIAGIILSTEQLGLYCFAKNAGVGLSQSLVTAYMTGLYPYLCEQLRKQNLQEAIRKMFILSTAVATLFVLQSLVAPIYLPILFSSDWQDAYSLVAVLCLVGIPMVFLDSYGLVLRTHQKTFKESMLMLYAVLTIAISAYFLVDATAIALANNILMVSLLWFIPVAAYLLKSNLLFQFPKRRFVS
ncbi:Teichuronic acid biosynthesis protein TuaB [Thalassocella blandensis]|nr:Teichuronic acid biosynthesis protein TuaB [Thalassocella blandensis]